MLIGSKLTAVELLLLVALVGTACLASIDKSDARDPVRVTHRNSGPSYEIDRDENSNDVERTKLSSSSDDDSSMPPMMRPVKPMGEREADNWQPSVGHVSIRRIFLVPMRPNSGPAGSYKPQEDGANEPSAHRHHPLLFNGPMGPSSDEREGAPLRQPFWPFMSPSASSLHHLFGQDSASRSPNAPKDDMDDKESSSPAKPDEKNQADGKQMIDPIQLMIEMMQHALSSAAMMPQPQPSPSSTDLNKEASANKDEDERKETGMERPDDLIKRIIKPLNETKEEVVEIDGKKYLRKTIVNRHVGENMVFMTRRLVFVPLNETEPASPTTTSAPAPTTTTTTLVSEQPSTTNEETDRKTEVPMTTTEAPATTTAWSTSTEAASTATAASQPEEMTTPKDVPSEKEPANSNERLVSSTSPKPTESTTATDSA